MERNVVAASENAPAIDPTTTTTSTSLTKQCKFCSEEEMGDDPLIVSCNCKGGTLQWLHVSCLNQWRTENDRVSAFPKCKECKTKHSPISHYYSSKLPGVTFASGSSCTTGTVVGSPVPFLRCNDRPPTPGMFGSNVASILEAPGSIGEGEELESSSGSPSSVLTQAPCAQTFSKSASLVSFDENNEGSEAWRTSNGGRFSTSFAGATPRAANGKTSKKVRFSTGPNNDGNRASKSSGAASGSSPYGSTPTAYGSTTSSPIPGPSPGNGLTAGLFGGNPTAVSSDGCVGSSSATTNGGLFGSSPPWFGLFGTQPAPTSSRNQAGASLFPTRDDHARPPSAPTNGGLFGSPPPSSGLFGTQPAPTDGGIFGSSPPGSGLFGTQPAPNSTSNGNDVAPSRSFLFSSGSPSANAYGATLGSVDPNISGPFGATPVGGGLFGSASNNSPTSTFGKGAPTAPLFGSPFAHSSASATGTTKQASLFGSPFAHSSTSATGTTQASLFGSPLAHSSASGTTQARDNGSRAGGFLFNAGSTGIATASHSAPGPGFNFGGMFYSAPNQAAPSAAASSTQFLFGSQCVPNNSEPTSTSSVRTNTYYFGNHGVSVPVSVPDTLPSGRFGNHGHFANAQSSVPFGEFVPSGRFGNHGHFANAQSSVPFGGFGDHQTPATTVRPGGGAPFGTTPWGSVHVPSGGRPSSFGGFSATASQSPTLASPFSGFGSFGNPTSQTSAFPPSEFGSGFGGTSPPSSTGFGFGSAPPQSSGGFGFGGTVPPRSTGFGFGGTATPASTSLGFGVTSTPPSTGFAFGGGPPPTSTGFGRAPLVSTLSGFSSAPPPASTGFGFGGPAPPASTGLAFGGFSTPASTGFGFSGASPPSSAGFGRAPSPASNCSGFSGTPPPATTDFRFGGASPPASTQPVSGGGTTRVPFQSTNGRSSTTLQSVTAMAAYENKSFEELRCEDYQAGNFGTRPGSSHAPLGTDFAGIDENMQSIH